MIIDSKHVLCEQTKAKTQPTKGIIELAVFKLITDHHSMQSSYVEEEDMNYQVGNSNTSSKEASGRTTDEVVQQISTFGLGLTRFAGVTFTA